jgi:hypothetical protein
MMALIASEWRRLLSRRLVRFGALVAVGLIIFSGVMVFLQSGRDEKQYLETRSGGLAQGIEKCMQDENIWGPNADEIPEEQRRLECENMVGFDPRFRYTDSRDALKGAGAAFILLAFLIGASFMGAEWHFGTITTTLTWEPRRLRVLAAKALTAAVMGVLLFVLLQAFLAAVLYPAAAAHGVTEGIDSAWMRSVLGDVGRGTAMAAVGSVVGLGMASIGRNTATALGGGFVYFAVLEPLLRAIRPTWALWLVGDNATVFANGTRLEERSVVEAGIILLVYATLLIVLSAALFKRRDVTT